MKPIVTALIFILIVCLLPVQSPAQDRTGTMQVYYADSLVAGRTTIDVKVSSTTGIGYYQVTAWAANDNDDLQVSILAPDKGREQYVRHGLINLADASTAAAATLTTTPKDFVVISGSQVGTFRFTSGTLTSKVNFVVAGRSGVMQVNPVSLTIVGALPQDSLNVKLNRAEVYAAIKDSLAVLMHRKDTLGVNQGTYATTTMLRDTSAKYIPRESLQLVFGTTQIILRDSIQVTVANLTTATGLAIVCYRAPDNNIVSADTAASFRINTAGKLTIVGKNGAWYDYWVLRK